MQPQENDVREVKPCACGRKAIKEVYVQGSWLSVHSVWDGGSNFGSLGMSPCCAQCSEDERGKMFDDMRY